MRCQLQFLMRQGGWAEKNPVQISGVETCGIRHGSRILKAVMPTGIPPYPPDPQSNMDQ